MVYSSARLAETVVDARNRSFLITNIYNACRLQAGAKSSGNVVLHQKAATEPQPGQQ
jgi:hypothetical protein